MKLGRKQFTSVKWVRWRNNSRTRPLFHKVRKLILAQGYVQQARSNQPANENSQALSYLLRAPNDAHQRMAVREYSQFFLDPLSGRPFPA